MNRTTSQRFTADDSRRRTEAFFKQVLTTGAAAKAQTKGSGAFFRQPETASEFEFKLSVLKKTPDPLAPINFFHSCYPQQFP